MEVIHTRADLSLFVMWKNNTSIAGGTTWVLCIRNVGCSVLCSRDRNRGDARTRVPGVDPGRLTGESVVRFAMILLIR